MFHFYTPGKRHKTGFLTFSGGMEVECWLVSLVSTKFLSMFRITQISKLFATISMDFRMTFLVGKNTLKISCANERGTFRTWLFYENSSSINCFCKKLHLDGFFFWQWFNIKTALFIMRLYKLKELYRPKEYFVNLESISVFPNSWTRDSK